MTRAYVLAVAGAAALSLLVGAAIEPSQAPFTRTPTPNATGHVYVEAGGRIERFPIVGGVPVKPRDLLYPGTRWNIIAVGPGGDLYALTALSGPTFGIDVFKAGGTTIVRELNVTAPSGYSSLGIFTIGLDSGGYLYVGYLAAEAGKSQIGVFVFKPFAHGNEAPVQDIVLPKVSLGSLALDAQDNLYLPLGLPGGPSQNGEILVYANPRTAPTLERTIYGPAIQFPEGVTIDDTGELYVLNHDTAPNQPGGNIAAFRDTVSGSAKPDRVFYPTPLGLLVGKVAVSNRNAFAIEFLGGSPVFLQLDKNVSGPQTPVAQLTFERSLGSFAIGP